MTIDGRHVLIDESQGGQQAQAPPVSQRRKTPQELVAAIPLSIRTEMAKAIDDSNRPTANDKKSGFHEESGVAGFDASGNWVVSRDVPGPYGDPATATHLSSSFDPVDERTAFSIVDPQVTFHVHPDGKAFHLLPSGRIDTRNWNQPPSDKDEENSINPQPDAPNRTNIVFAAGEKKVYFYDESGVLGTMSLKDFLRR